MRFLSKMSAVTKSITTTLSVVVMLVLFITSCKKENTEVVEVAFNPETTYTMKTTDIVELVSDSGIIRYKMTADEWYIYEKAQEPYYYFPEGAYVERFDTLFNKDMSVEADTVYYFYKKELWELIGNVKIVSLKGEKFNTEHLFWDQKTEKIYSDEYIRIEQEDKIITGIGFESNQSMTKYNVFNSQGVFPVTETRSDTIPQPADSTLVSPQEMALN